MADATKPTAGATKPTAGATKPTAGATTPGAGRTVAPDDAKPDAGKSEKPEKGRTSDVQCAIRLGWQMAKVYHSPPPARPGKPDPAPAHLPGASEIGDYLTGKMLIGEIEHDLAELTAATRLDPRHLATITALKDEGVGPARVQADVLSVFTDLLVELAASESQLQTALGLGRMLSDTVLLSDARNPATFAYEFSAGRLSNAYGWLGDLHRELPPHAADAVSGSLRAWEGWVAAHPGADELTGMHAGRVLGVQGKLWRQLLCGDRLAEDLLTPPDYATASSRLIDRFRGILRTFIKTWWIPIVSLLIAVGVIVGLTLGLAPNATAKVTAVIVTAAGALGVSWKTLSSTVGRAITQSKDQLWNAEVNESIIVAATFLPAPPPAPAGTALSRAVARTRASRPNAGRSPDQERPAGNP
jgi:hypothetical protein